MSWSIAPTLDLAAVHGLRRSVFIDEQGIPETAEWDDLDHSATHLLATVNDLPMGTARLLIRGDTGWVGRICVLKPARGTGLGAALVREAIKQLSARPGLKIVRLGAQAYAKGFYEKLGFRVCGPEYDDAGIPHHEMELML